MKNETRDRRVAKIWVAWNDQTIEAAEALVKIHDLFKEECQSAWMWYMNMTDEARRRWLKEVMT